MLLLVSLAALASYGVFLRSSPFASPRITESASPRVTAGASRKTYIVGEPISINYRVINEGGSEIHLDNGSISESDSRLYVTVRTMNGARLPVSPAAFSIGADWVSQTERTSRSKSPDTLIVNDMIPIAHPGLYRVTVHVDVNPTGSVGDESHCVTTIRVIDTPQARAKRRARIAFAAKTLRDAKASAQAKAEAVRALEYNNEPEALPVLLDAYTSSDGNIRAAARAFLTVWHDPGAVSAVADARIESLARNKKSANEPDWEHLQWDLVCQPMTGN